MANAQNRTLRPGQSLFIEGESPRSMFLITKGTVAIRKSKGSAFVEIAKLNSNEVVGELSFFDRQPRSASAFALTDVEVTEIPFEALDKLFGTTPPYLKAMIAAMADRLRKANEIIKRLQKNTVSEGDGVQAATTEDLDAATALAAASTAFDQGSGDQT